mmetsp:Transcript_128253/g.362950  ORF Transcript_128253/g.362950 Transcript_128253/m.362950 type:complete len:211 (-) Transcript_128253:168-800(-)
MRQHVLPATRGELLGTCHLHLRADNRQHDPLEGLNLDRCPLACIVPVKRVHTIMEHGIIEADQVESLDHPVDELVALPPPDGPREVGGAGARALGERVLHLHCRIDNVGEGRHDGLVWISQSSPLLEMSRETPGLGAHTLHCGGCPPGTVGDAAACQCVVVLEDLVSMDQPLFRNRNTNQAHNSSLHPRDRGFCAAMKHRQCIPCQAQDR